MEQVVWPGVPFILCLSSSRGGNHLQWGDEDALPAAAWLWAFPGLLLPSAGHIWNGQTAPPSADTQSSRLAGVRVLLRLPWGAAAPTALASLCEGWPHCL